MMVAESSALENQTREDSTVAIAELRQELALLRSQMPQTAESDVIEGHVHHAIPTRVAASGDLPATRQRPTLYYVTGPPVQLFLVDKDGQRELGWSAQALCTADTAIDGTERDVTGCSMTLPVPGTYLITGVFDMEAHGGTLGDTAVGKLTDASNVAETAIATFRPTAQPSRATVTQRWRISTTANNEVWKLRVLRDGANGTSLRTKQNHTTITASSFLGGEQTATSHQHSHDTGLTDVSADDHHTEGHVARHADGGADEVTVENLATVGLINAVLKSDGAGGLTMGNVQHSEVVAVTEAQHHAKYLDSEARTAVPYLATITFGWDPQSPQIFAP